MNKNNQKKSEWVKGGKQIGKNTTRKKTGEKTKKNKKMKKQKRCRRRRKNEKTRKIKEDCMKKETYCMYADICDKAR